MERALRIACSADLKVVGGRENESWKVKSRKCAGWKKKESLTMLV